jgi:hypothetical protein
MATSEILCFFPSKCATLGAFVPQKFFVPCHTLGGFCFIVVRNSGKKKERKKKKVVYLGLTLEENILY